ncbi:hypothetical protein M3215_13265 [Bacillus cytotoxicus]|uniref:Uncharacterized protein n=1 Tax=Bacillus cytotoxicus TaxID=580165 RepID=A0ACC6A8F1_9BACI|nr:hypothetical protein [Bacillus cytotoxicus]
MKETSIIDYDNLDKEIEKFQERIEAHRQERIARELPPERPERFVGKELSTLLTDKVEHLFKYFKGYSALLVKTKKLQPTQYGKVHEKYGDYILLLSEATALEHSMTGGCLQKLLKTLKLIDANEISYEKASRDIYYAFKDLELRDAFKGFELRGCDFSRANEKPLPEMTRKQQRRSYRLQNDEAFFNSEIQRYLAYYERIKHLI